jgi:hypothetical protein
MRLLLILIPMLGAAGEQSTAGKKAAVPSHAAPKKPTQPSKPAVQDEYFFVWRRPLQIPNNLPLTDSTTCRFKKSVSAGYQPPSDDKEHPPEGISYSASDEDETDTVTFINLDTPSPTVRSNGGQAAVKVIYRDAEMTTVVHTSLTSEIWGGAVEMYTIFKQTGVIIHSQQKDSLFAGPFGVPAMGYCN